MNDRASMRPPSELLADDLRRAIANGDLAPGSRLPSEREMAQRHGLARNTVRMAVRLLAESGLVTSEHGRGVFVRRDDRLVRLGNDRYSPRYREVGLSPFLLECARQGKAGRFEVRSVTRMAPPPQVAAALGLPADAPSVLRRENVFWADADPVQLVTTWIPWAIAEGTGLLDDEVGHPMGIHGVLEQRGHVMARILDDITARMPTPDERAELRMPPGVPILDVTHVSVDTTGTPYELTRRLARADQNTLRYAAPVEYDARAPRR